MNDLSKKVLEIVKEHNGIKASDIAKILKCERSEVNRVLYKDGELKDYCWQDSKYLWYSNDVKKESDENVKKDFDEKLNSLCKYYLDCISSETNKGVSTFLTSKFAPLYIEIDGIDNENICTDIVSEYLAKNNNTKKSANYLGYPILIDKFTSKKGYVYYKQYPIFLWNVSYEGGKIEVDSLPFLNTEVLEKYSSSGTKELIYEQLQLEEELGLNNEEIDIPTDELVSRLQHIRSWNWKEEMNPQTIDISIPMEKIVDAGIYNRAVVISTERSSYTIGLESELLELSKMKKEEYEGTALYNWIYGISPENKESHSSILEVLPLNTEQYQAVDMALNQDLTIVTGPPGTGKSQVVTNILVNMALNGDSALFSSRNNKAVDVVYNRVNGLANKPVMLRVGGNAYANELAILIENILSSYADDTNMDNYNFYKRKYNEINQKREELLNDKNNLLKQRNKVDKLEQKICALGDSIRGKYNEISQEIVDEIIRCFRKYKNAYNSADKNLQDIFTKIFWKWKKQDRENALIESADAFNSLIQDYKIECPESVVEESLYLETIGKVENIIDELKILLEYKNELRKLDKEASLENMDKQIVEQNKKLSDLALKLWNEWILTRNNDISAYDRSKMTDYVSAMKLIGDADLNDYPDIKKKFRELQRKMTKYLPCWSVTSLSVKGRIPFSKGMFDLLIIDEASQCDIASILPLLYRAKRVAIIGDPKQLSHISSISREQDIKMIRKYEIDMKWAYSSTSLYDLASGLSSASQIVHLRDHHRSYGDIIEFSNKEFYDGRLRVATNYSRLRIPKGTNPGIRWVDITGEVIKPNSGSAYNLNEAQQIVSELKHLVDNDYKGSIGVVTPFRAQADMIRELVLKDKELYRNLSSNDAARDEVFLIDTVHKFQGDERDVILFSPVISNNTQNGTINFLSNTGHLFNVAITRARSMLIVVGDMKYCSDCSIKYMSDFTKYYKNLENKDKHPKEEYNYGKTREYPTVRNDEQVSEWEKEFYTSLFDEGIMTIPQYAEDKYLLDFAIIKDNNKLDIEIDGEMYHRDWNGELCYRDQLRNQRLYELGWDVKRFWVYQIRDEREKCIEDIKQWIKTH